MVRKRLLFSFLIYIGSLMCLYGEPRYELTDGIEQVYQMVWEMDFAGAKSAVANVKSEDPSNLLILLAEDYVDFTRIFLRDDMSGFEQYRDDVEKRLDIIKEAGDISPYYYYSQAEIYIHWSIARSKNGEVIRSGWDINRAFKLLEKCKKKYPDFKYVDKSLSVIHSLMGAIGGIKKTFIKLFTSLDGTVEQGIKEIDDLYNWDQSHPSMWSDEITMVQSLIVGHVKKDLDESLKIVQRLSEGKKQTLIGRFLIAFTASLAGENETSLKWLMYNKAADFSVLPELNVHAGNALLIKGDERAVGYYKTFIREAKGKNLLKAAHQKLAWCSLIFSDSREDYMSWMKKIPKIGDLALGEDQQAEQASKSGIVPNKVLLQARLLFDGGYHEDALMTIKQFEKGEYSPGDQLEYLYRKARIHQRLNNVDQAIVNYKQAINVGQNSKLYYACNSAIELARIYFENGHDNEALRFVDEALRMKPSERRGDLHQEAKLLKDRIKGRG